MKKPIKPTIALVTMALAAALPAGAKDPAVVSAWAETPVAVDGLSTDWAGATLQTVKNLGIDYAFKNDGSNLYVLVVFNDRRSLSSIEATGMTLYFSSEMKKRTDRGLRFTKRTLTPEELIVFLEKDGQKLSPERKQDILSRESYAIFECQLINKKGAVIAENAGSTAPHPPLFRQASMENSVVYEFRVPLAGTEIQPAGIGIRPGEKLKVGFAWGGLTAQMKEAVAKESGYGGGQAGAEASSWEIVSEDIGLDSGNQGSSFSQRLAQLQRLMKKHEFWTDVLLAVK